VFPNSHHRLITTTMHSKIRLLESKVSCLCNNICKKTLVANKVALSICVCHAREGKGSRFPPFQETSAHWFMTTSRIRRRAQESRVRDGSNRNLQQSTVRYYVKGNVRGKSMKTTKCSDGTDNRINNFEGLGVWDAPNWLWKKGGDRHVFQLHKWLHASSHWFDLWFHTPLWP
jgi:hypothetical protein